jgi:heme/copper-type cytochrome/quinol oxidase subunit 2
MKRCIVRALLTLSLLIAVVVPAAPAFAATNPFGDTCAIGAGRNSAVCQRSGGDPVTTNDGVIHRVTQLLAIIAGVIAVIVIVVGGIRYIASGGDAEQVSRAKRTIIWAVVGLAVIVSGQTIINFIISRI